MSLKNFIGQLNVSDVARTNRFVLTLLLPPKLRAYMPHLETISLFTSEITGAMSWNLSSKGESFGGIQYSTPYSAFMEDQFINVTFMTDGNAMIRHLFDDWAATSFNPRTAQVEYYDNLRTRMRIELLNRSDIPIYAWELHDIMLDKIVPINLGNEAPKVLELTVVFAFRFWEKVKPTPVTAIRRQEENSVLELYRIVKPYLSARFPQLGRVNQKVSDINLGIRALGSVFGT